MSIIKYYHHQGNISELSGRYPSFSRLHNTKIKELNNNLWKDKKSGESSYHLMTAIFGKTGYGKSSTTNAFFGRSIMDTSDVDACTRVCNSLDYEITPGHYFSLGDFPGIGENEYRDDEYLKMYKDFMRHVSVIIYVVRADARDYSVDEIAYQKLFTTDTSRKKIIIAINYCDKIEPISRRNNIEPTPEQMENIEKKVEFIKEKFQPKNAIIPYSAATGWNMSSLAEEVVNVCFRSGSLIKTGLN